MRASLIAGFGPAGVLEHRELPIPHPGPGEVLIRVRACGVCRLDILEREGMMRGLIPPRVLGHEIAGDVEALGPGVTSFAVGDRIATTQRRVVCGLCGYCRNGDESLCAQALFFGHDCEGGYADYTVCSEGTAAAIPPGIPYEHAAIAACAIGTELNAIRDTARVQIGETVLFTGASGGVGAHGVQIARAAGARVIAVTRSQAKVASLRELGAHDVVVIEGGRFAESVRALTGQRGVDVVIDNVGTALFHEVRRSLALRGRWIMTGEIGKTRVEFNMAQVFLRAISLHSVNSTSRAQLIDALDLIANGTLRPIIDRVFRLEESVEAHRHVESGGSFGRTVLKLN